MKKYIFGLLLVLCFTLVSPSTVHAANGVIMALPAQPVDPELAGAVYQALVNGPELVTKYWAIGAVSTVGDHWIISLIGLTGIGEDLVWNIDNNAVTFSTLDMVRGENGFQLVGNSSGNLMTLDPNQLKGAQSVDGGFLYGDNMSLASLGATATASSTYYTGTYPASMAIDGDDATYWEGSDVSAPCADDWIQIDLGTSRTIMGFRLNHNASLQMTATIFKIQTSPDGINFTDLESFNTGNKSDTTWSLRQVTDSRYWKFTCISGGTGPWKITTLAMYELTPWGGNLALDAYAASVITDSNLNTNYIGHNVIDNDDTTYWEAGVGAVTNHWIKINLGSVQSISGIRMLQWVSATNNASTYQIQTSNDDQTYTTVYTRTIQGIDDAYMLPQATSAQYIKFVPTVGGNSPWIIKTIEIYQSPNALESPPPIPDQYAYTQETSYIFPWYPGSAVAYGPRAVHPEGYSTGWLAVDLWSNGGTGMAPNQVYAAASGTIHILCNDGFQQWLRIGDLTYGHLEIGSWREGQSVTQKESLGAMKTGTFDTRCGYAIQNAGSWHLHLGFPGGYGSISFENCTLNMATQKWDCGGSIVDVGGNLTSTWTGTPIINPGSGGSIAANNLWGYLINGIKGIVGFILPIFPDGNGIGVLAQLINYADAPLEIIYVIILSNIPMTIPALVVTFIISSEVIRWAYAAYMKIKRAIPVVG
jgi:hypothetical protein